MLLDVSTLSFSPPRAQKASFSEGRRLPSGAHGPAVEGRQVPPRLAVLLCRRGTTEGPDRGWQGFRIWQAGENVPEGRKEGLGWLWEFCPRNTAFTQMHVFPSKARDLTR